VKRKDSPGLRTVLAIVTGLIVGLVTTTVIQGQQTPPPLGSGGFVMPQPTPRPGPTLATLPQRTQAINPTQAAHVNEFLARVPTPNATAIRPTIEAIQDAGWQRFLRRTPAKMEDTTRGKRITIAGRSVQLPSDAFIIGTSHLVNCGGGTECPDFPSIVIQRGKSTVWVGTDTGRIVNRSIAPGEDSQFNFLREALR
jgi:hypothetical protein